MNLLQVLFAWYLCLSSSADARRIWCYCDRGLCTTDKYYSEPCSNVLPVAIRDHLLDVFFEPNKTKISLRVFMETMMEKGVDQSTVAEIVKDITPDDMMLLEKAVGGNAESLRQVYDSMEQDTMLELMKFGMDELRTIKRDRKLTEMSNDRFIRSKDYVVDSFKALGLPEDELIAVRKGITKQNVRHFWKMENRLELASILKENDGSVRNITIEFMNTFDKKTKVVKLDYKYGAPKSVQALIKVLKKSFGSINMHYKITDIVIASLGERKEALEEFLGPELIRHQFIYCFLKVSRYGYDATAALLIAELSAAHASNDLLTRKLIEKYLSQEYCSLIEGIMHAPGYWDATKPLINASNILEFIPRGIQLKDRIVEELGETNPTTLIHDYMMNITPLRKSNETDAMDVAFFYKNYMDEVNARMVDRQERAANRKTEDVEQFCMMALLKDRREIRFCGHFASQLTGFQFREGCHYEQVLGLAEAYFCRCADHMCNRSVAVASGWSYVAVVVMLLLLT